jgi:hypothetical protein
MVRPKGVHVQDVTTLVLMPKIHQGFGNVMDVMTCYVPWANVGEYIERIKNNKEAPCQSKRWHYDQPQNLKKARIDSHIGHHWYIVTWK